ncbi:MAG: septation ring formation regulator EzrA [Mycoplasmataceae bacterium]|jgi:hypothetical protein|nr:septation ring formation regulator EzrA [Mycoplasmataceae bacterium]
MVSAIRGINPEYLALTIIGSFFIIVFGFFSIVFFFHRKLLQNEYQLKERYNEIAQFLAANKFKYLEVLAKSNVQLKMLMTQITDGKKIFEQQLEIVRKKLMSLTVINSRYSYLSSYKLSKEIKNDLSKCDGMVNNLRNVSVSATQYSKDISDLLIEYRKITDEITHFYEFNLVLRYSNEVFDNMGQMIKETITQSAQYVVKFDNDKLLILLHELNTRVSNFYQVTMQLYTLDKILMYLESLKKRIKDELHSAEKILSSTDYSSVETAFATGSSNITLMERNLKSLSFKAAKNNAMVASKQLSEALLKIEAGDRTNVLIQKDMKALKDQVTILYKEFNDVNNAFTNIQKYFSAIKDASIINKTTKLVNDMKGIVLYYQNLENEFTNYRLIQRTDFLYKIRELGNKVIEFKIQLNNLIDEIGAKYKNSITINDELADIKLTLAQLLGIKLQHTASDQNGINTIKNIIEHIDQLQTQLTTNYFQNYAIVNDELTKIREQTSLLITSATYNQSLKIYAQRLIYYVNKYRNEHAEIAKSLSIAENLYQKGQYQNTIDQMIETVSVILSSAKNNNIIVS